MGVHMKSKHEHEKHLEVARAHLASEEAVFALSDFFRIFADSTRMRILCALGTTELCVCAISELLGMTQSAISHQLKVLRTATLVKTRREGKTVYYSLADEHVHTLIRTGMEHIDEKRESK